MSKFFMQSTEYLPSPPIEVNKWNYIMKINAVRLNNNVKHQYNENKIVLIKRMFKLCGITLFFTSIHVSCNSCIIEF